ncbi:MAG TPA: alpha/beta hydrolase [Bryobacteraceae bacterium]|nr:alpha/beta hydrolase [Bryobacteraceae bacterium]
MSKGTSRLVATLLPVLFAFPCRPQQPAAAALSNVKENVSYGPGLLLDVYSPAAAPTSPRPAIILIHGGGWTTFDKSTMRPMGLFLARHGYVAFAVDYRLFRNGENPWPAQLDDVQRAVRWVRANSAKYDVNPKRIGAFGHSAGAQLAALLGMEDTRDNSDPELAKYSSKVQAVVDVSGPSDFTRDHDSNGDSFLAKFLNASYSKHPEVWREASPVFRVSKNDAPFLIMHGTQDDEVPISQSQELLAKLQSAGVPASLIKVNDVHTFRTPEARHELALQTLAFFDRYLGAAQ